MGMTGTGSATFRQQVLGELAELWERSGHLEAPWVSSILADHLGRMSDDSGVSEWPCFARDVVFLRDFAEGV
jgi:hypothetical protein